MSESPRFHCQIRPDATTDGGTRLVKGGGAAPQPRYEFADDEAAAAAQYAGRHRRHAVQPGDVIATASPLPPVKPTAGERAAEYARQQEREARERQAEIDGPDDAPVPSWQLARYWIDPASGRLSMEFWTDGPTGAMRRAAAAAHDGRERGADEAVSRWREDCRELAAVAELREKLAQAEAEAAAESGAAQAARDRAAKVTADPNGDMKAVAKLDADAAAAERRAARWGERVAALTDALAKAEHDAGLAERAERSRARAELVAADRGPAAEAAAELCAAVGAAMLPLYRAPDDRRRPARIA